MPTPSTASNASRGDGQSISTYSSVSSGGSKKKKKNPVKKFMGKIFRSPQKQNASSPTSKAAAAGGAATTTTTTEDDLRRLSAKKQQQNSKKKGGIATKTVVTGDVDPETVKTNKTVVKTARSSASAYIQSLSEALKKAEETMEGDGSKVNTGLQTKWNQFKDEMKHAKQQTADAITNANANLTELWLSKLEINDQIQKITPPVWHRVRTKRHPAVMIREEDGITQLGAIALLEPDTIMDQYMAVVLTKRTQGITVSKLYDICWKTKDFYKQWLLKDSKQSIQVGDWEYGTFSYPSTSTSTLIDDQTYSQRRTITYSYDRDPSCLGYKLGQPNVDCTQTMYYHSMDNHQRAIIAIVMDMKGEVCSDTFRVHIRGVITKAATATVSASSAAVTTTKASGETAASTTTTETNADMKSAAEQDDNGLLVDFGVHTEFTKRTMLQKQIRGIVEDATKSSVQTLFDLILETFGDDVSETVRSDPLEHSRSSSSKDPYNDDDDGDDKKNQKCCFSLFGC